MRPSHLNDEGVVPTCPIGPDPIGMQVVARPSNDESGQARPRTLGRIHRRPVPVDAVASGRNREDGATFSKPLGASDAAVLERARREYAACEMRWSRLGPSISSDPAWNILLDLLISEIVGTRLSVTAVCVGARSSSTTGIRYISMLQSEGLLDRVPDAHDRRRTYVQLTQAGRQTVCELLDAD